MTNPMITNLAQQVGSLRTREEVNTIIHAIRIAQHNIAQSAKLQFMIGDRVSFASKYGGIERGTITRIMPKNIAVKSDSGTTWRVTPSLLTKETSTRSRGRG